MTGELLKLADVVGRRFAHQIAERPFLLRLRQPRANDLDDGLRLFRVLHVGLGETFVDVGHLLRVGRFAAQDFDVARAQFAGPFHRRRNMALAVGLRPLSGHEVEAKLRPAL